MNNLKIDGNIIEQDSPEQKNLSGILWMLAALFIVQSILYISRGATHLDEGHHFNFSLLVYQGKVPYLDFWLYQPPLFPYIYGLPQYIFGPNMYVARATSFLFTALLLLLVYRISKKLLNPLAGVIAVALIVSNPCTVFHFNSIELYSLAGFLLLLSIYWIIDEPKLPYRITLSVFFMSLACAVRLSMGAALLVLMIYIFITERNRPRNIIIAVATACITCCLIWGPFILLGIQETIFGNIGWYFKHTQFVFFYKWNDLTLRTLLRDKFDVITQMVRNFPSIFVLLPACIAFIFWTLQGKANQFQTSSGLQAGEIDGSTPLTINPERPLFIFALKNKVFWPRTYKKFNVDMPMPQLLFLLSSLMALFVIHFCASPTFLGYFLYSLPLAAILCGFCLSWIFFNFPNPELRKLLVAFLIILIVITPPLQGKGALPKLTGISHLGYINKIASLVKKMTSKDDEILTFTQQFATVADRRIISGLEFSYPGFAPDWNRRECEKYHLYNTEILLDYVTSRKAKLIVLTDQDYQIFSHQGRYIKGPFVWELFLTAVNQNYRLIKKIDAQGAWLFATYIYIPKV